MPGKSHWLARARLTSGLVLLAYLVSHLLNHSLGVVSLDAMEAGRLIFLGLWRNPAGTVLLYGALAVHLALVLYSLLRRRTLRMPLWEAAQIVLGFAVVPLLVLHVVATRGLHEFFAVDDRYAYVLASIYVFDPWAGLQQAAALIVAWSHGAMGLHFWLRFRPWYGRLLPYLYALALLLPAAALAGFMSAGHEVELLLQDPAWSAALRARVGWPTPEAGAWAYRTRDAILIALPALLLAILAGRVLRALWERRRGIVALTYPDGRQVKIRPGVTALEASRGAGIPHASVCGGRGRCSTCRVRVGYGGDKLPPPSVEESRVLARVGAPPGVRLACQIRPVADLEIAPLLAPGALPRDAFRRPGHLLGAEREIAILFADLRAFTRFAESKLPFDVVFVINQYFRAMGEAIEQAGGRVDKFIGDGVMALFGIEADAGQGCRQALMAARTMSAAINELNRTLKHDLDEPIAIGIGIHMGPVIVGEMGYGRTRSITAIGDAVNTASRLETATKEFGCQLVVSASVAARAGLDLSSFATAELELRGHSEALTVHLIASALDLPRPGAATREAPPGAARR